ncbi:MAG: PDZ domain-containing protein [Verrucomicrobiaceae bacterium]|nr:PDZ domain-containing protein [Verrucomicrobiaceae bacterium]
MKLHRSLLLALAASATALTAQQPDAPPPPDAPKPPKAPEARSSSREHRGESAPKEKAVAYMGVLTREVPVELRSQFGLPEGFGLMVDEVMPDSPAQSAGIKTHDILVKFADQQLVNMEQLLTLVRSKKKGEVVPFTVITGGKETQVSVTLAERMMPANEMRQPNRGFPGMPQMPQMQQFFGGGGQDVREHMEQLQRQMREYQERIQEWNRDGHRGPFPQMPGAHREERRGAGSSSRDGNAHAESHAESHTASNIIRRDDTGEYQLKNEDGKRTFTVRPKNGQEQSWPVNTDAERQAVPEKFREKLRLFDNVHQDLRGPDAPRPPEGGPLGNPPPAPKGRETSV